MLKKILVLVLSLLLIATIGCEEKEQSQGGESEQGQEEQQQNQQQQNLYTGFQKPSEGQWVEYVWNIDGQEMTQKIECVGQEVVDGKNCIGFETSMDFQRMKAILQMWVEKDTGNYVKYVIKMNNQVYCVSPYNFQTDQTQQPPATETPDAYDPSNVNFTLANYTVPGNGQTINVAVFHGVGQSETWVSSEVPFGMVRVIDENGNDVMHLHNFGMTGAHRDISAEERDNCQSFPSFP